MARTTYEALEAWGSLIDEVSSKWGDLMDEAWLDLPPCIIDSVITASHGFADAADAINEAMQSQPQGEEICD